MRTMFVNPRRRPKRRHAKKRNPRKTVRRIARRRPVKRNTRKAHTKMKMNPRRRRSHKARRRNPMAPFVRSLNNPLILRNPRAIRRRRRNPGLNLSIKSILDKSLSYGGGSALGAGINIIGLSKIENTWFRNGARLGVAVLGGSFLKGDLGAAMAGATLYPMWQEIALFLSLIEGPHPFMPYPEAPTAAKTEASLDLLSADLQDVLDEAAAAEMYDNYN